MVGRKGITSLCDAGRALMAMGIVAAFAAPAAATTVIFNDFSSTSGLALNGSAAQTTTSDGKVIRLVPAAPGQGGTFFSSAAINAATFSTAFTFRISNPGGISDGTDVGADGLVFVVQSVSSSLGGSGGDMGYGGINHSVGVGFDTFQNSWDADSNHAEIIKNGDVTNELSHLFVSPNFDDGNLWHAWVDYDGTTLQVRANETGVYPATPLLSLSIDIPTILGQNTAYVGFTAGTGAAWGNHDITSWTYHDSFQPPTTGAPLPASVWAGLVLLAGLGARRVIRKRVTS